ncbi:CRM-domain containing factor CFM2, chloroplastic [Vitis vinifera]|uniref:CRM-domain containing factor CFM2, chloroplastic n=1 Tax=Vitis vinifera TaxID=29760 RepID=A0A438JIT3_VITVI|nr:CRM-domain containing factor CFM2, chloroplastic [Vitis vinifera]
MNNEEHDGKEVCSSGKGDVKSAGPMPANKIAPLSLIQGVGYPTRVRFQLPGEAQLEEEADRLLDGLGPRFTDWWGYDPLPIDADLLPAVVPGYRRPFRLLPYGLKPKLTNDEMTVLRRLGRPLPCHFALGRNRKLQGLAASMIKLWEKCEIAKIAVKRGVQNTNSEMMAEELKSGSSIFGNCKNVGWYGSIVRFGGQLLFAYFGWFLVLVNGTPSGFFQSSRGLRQGDLLSPYLFVLAMEVLSCILERARESGFLSGFKVSGGNAEKGLEISHLLFVDDTFVFYKSELILIGRVSNVMELVAIFGYKVGALPSTYLGLSLGATHNWVVVWDRVEERFRKRLAMWKRGWCSKEVRGSYGVGLWKAIRLLWELVSFRTLFVVGNGRRVKFWRDRWCGDEPLCVSFPSLFAFARSKKAWVADLWVHSSIGGEWNPSFSRPLNDWEFETMECFLLGIQDKVVVDEREDDVFWVVRKSGSFSVKSFLSILEEVRVSPFPSSIVWNAWVLPKPFLFCSSISWLNLLVVANLTGGTLLSRDREFIVFYRGKDFLPPAVSSAIEARRKYGIHRGKQKIDHHRLAINAEESELGTSEHASDKDCDGTDDQKTNSLSKRRMLRSAEAVVERTSIKLSMALEKKERAEKLLAELEEAQIPQQPEIDKEGITEEERYMLRKVGLRMKPFLLLGRRGIFDGTVENMHLHWKYRELVKIISNGRSIEDIHGVARTLEAESGGILVAVERVSKGYAIIMYRGKNYKRPASLRPQTLLNKREAMKRSLEAQRRESLKLHVLRLTRNIDELKHQLFSRNKDKETNSKQLVDKSRLHLADAPHLAGEGAVALLLGLTLARERYGADVILIHSSDGMDSSRDSLQTSHNDKRIDFPSMYDSDTDEANPEPSSESVLKEIETNVLTDMNEEEECATCSDDLVSQGQTSCYAIVNHEETMESSVKSSKNEFKPPVQRPVDTRSNEMPFRAAPLSNRERLLLRKQALRMKKRPVIAVGRSNIVTGVAKTIKAHFQKHPLAIVNVKGRAKGTSVQEVVFKLEQATGAVLVSQEPSKVILYRGCGAREENGRSDRMNRSDARKTSAGREGGPRPTVSPELRAAIRLECGLKSNQDKGADPN